MESLSVGTKVTNGTYTGKVRKILDRFTVTVAWGPMMDDPNAATTVESSVNLQIKKEARSMNTIPKMQAAKEAAGITFGELSPYVRERFVDTMIVYRHGVYWATLFVDRSNYPGEYESVELMPLGHVVNANIITEDYSVWVKAENILSTIIALSKLEEVPF